MNYTTPTLAQLRTGALAQGGVLAYTVPAGSAKQLYIVNLKQ